MSTGASPDIPPAVLERLAVGRVGRLATQGADGRPDVVPITFALVDGTRLVTAVDHKPKSTRRLRRLERIRRHPVVTVLVDHYDDDDWDRLWWVRVTGPASVIDVDDARPGAADTMIDALVAKYPQYRRVRPEGPVIVVTPTAWQWWSAVDGAGRATLEPPNDPEPSEEQP